MPGIATPYVRSYRQLGLGAINFETATIKVLLTTASYTPSTAHEFRSHVTSEIAAAGYTPGGATVTGVTWGWRDDVTPRPGVTGAAVLGCNPVTWQALTVSGLRRAVAYVDTGNPATSPLLSHLDFGSAQTLNGAIPFTVTYADGLYRLFRAPA